MTPPGSTPPPPGPDGTSGPGRGEPAEDGGAPAAAPRPSARQARKQVLLRLDPQVYDALARWAGEELRSANAQIEFLLRRALSEAGRLPSAPGPIPRRGRPPRPADRPPD